MLYIIYTPVRTINEKQHPLIGTEKNEYNTFIKLEEIIENLENMENDFIPTTSEESAGNYNIQSLFNSLTSYTNLCGSQPHGIWTTVTNNCPTNGNPGIIDNNNCKILKEYYPDLDQASCNSGTLNDAQCEATKISDYYNAHLLCPDQEAKIIGYSQTLLQYYIQNKKIINDIIGASNDGPITSSTTRFTLNMVNNEFKNNFITPIEKVIKNIDEKITTKVYETFNEFLNDKTEDTYQLRNSKDFNLFSWMN